ncbi:MAG: hypothetical protein ISS15_15595, partial [Alphaproteobacteria bacterium]|nr:hypothetical protein [Alphaproteobacteria bacterium]MBL7099083.1 hypothetical protein [Alphaproteobacteria bacterium]
MSSLPAGALIPELTAANEAPRATQAQGVAGQMTYYAVQTSRKVADQTVFVEVVQNLQHPDVIFDDVIADFLRRMAVFMVPA